MRGGTAPGFMKNSGLRYCLSLTSGKFASLTDFASLNGFASLTDFASLGFS